MLSERRRQQDVSGQEERTSYPALVPGPKILKRPKKKNSGEMLGVEEEYREWRWIIGVSDSTTCSRQCGKCVTLLSQSGCFFGGTFFVRWWLTG